MIVHLHMAQAPLNLPSATPTNFTLPLSLRSSRNAVGVAVPLIVTSPFGPPAGAGVGEAPPSLLPVLLTEAMLTALSILPTRPPDPPFPHGLPSRFLH